MYRVILADDNPLVLQSLKKTIPWETLGITVAAEAEDGVQLKKVLKEYQPELLVTDIRMPGLSGLDVIDYLKKQGMATKVIIITGYREFQYAQQAVKLGVFDFVVKPIRDEELIRILKTAVEKLNQESQERSQQRRLVEENQNYRKKIESADKIVGKQTLRELAYGRQQKTGETAALRGKKWFYIVCRIRSQEEERGRKAILHLKELLDKGGEESLCLEIRENREIEFLFFSGKQDSASMANIRLKNRLLEMAEAVWQAEETALCFAVSSLSGGIENLAAMRNQASRVMHENFFSTREQILLAWHYDTVQLKPEGSVIRDLDHFYHFIDEMEEDGVEEEVKKLVCSIQQETGGNEFQVKCLLSELCITLYRKYCFRKPADKDQTQSINQILNEINALSELSQVQSYLGQFVRLIHQQNQPENLYDNPLVGKTIHYVQTHYSDPALSLTGLAEILNVNASYLSRLLKKETGMNFIDILTKTRINKAKQFLEEGKRVAQVGELVGYKDYMYFYQVFKRVEGVAPTEYKKKSR